MVVKSSSFLKLFVTLVTRQTASFQLFCHWHNLLCLHIFHSRPGVPYHRCAGEAWVVSYFRPILKHSPSYQDVHGILYVQMKQFISKDWIAVVLKTSSSSKSNMQPSIMVAFVTLITAPSDRVKQRLSLLFNVL